MGDKYIKVGDDLKKYFLKGETVVKENDPGASMFYIIEGEAVVVKKNVELAVLRKGDGFGEMALIIDTPRTASVIAKTDLMVMEVTRTMFTVAMSNMSQWESTLIKNLCERLKNITELFVLQDKSVIDVREMCSMLAQYYENKIPVQLMYEIYDRMYHMTRQEVMGKLKKLEQDGVLALYGDSISVN